jgi:paraquat-inducible protein B
MNEQRPTGPEGDALPQARVVAPSRTWRSWPSSIWIIPALAVLVALGIAVDAVLSEGPTVTIVLKSADGVEAGKTFVKYKDVNIGQVTAVQFSEDFEKVEVRAKIARSAARLMVDDAKFWVVQPRVTLSGVSGLGTLIAGNYIGFEAGQSSERSKTFVGLDTPPVINGGPGRQYLLRAADLGSLGIGSPVYLRRLQVGQVVAYDLARDGRTMEIKLRIDAPYDRYVTPRTRFWNASGLDVSLGTNGVDVRTESLVALLAGGIAFATPDAGERPGDDSADDASMAPAPADAVFALHPDRATAMKNAESIVHHYQLTFNESLRGLSIGAPITLFGLPVGVVTDVGLEYDARTHDVRPRVGVDVFPERLVARLAPQQRKSGQDLLQRSPERAHRDLERLVSHRGLRAQLRTGSLLTGQLYVALDFFPDAAPARVDWNAPQPQFPVVMSILPDVETKLSSLLAKLDRLPLEAIAGDLRGDLAALHTTLEQASALLARADAGVLPELEKTLAGARQTLASADRLMNSAERNLIGAHAPLQQDLHDALQELTRAARSLRVLSETLERNPEALLRGKPSPANGEP